MIGEYCKVWLILHFILTRVKQYIFLLLAIKIQRLYMLRTVCDFIWKEYIPSQSRKVFCVSLNKDADQFSFFLIALLNVWIAADARPVRST